MTTDYLLTLLLLIASHGAFFYAGIRSERVAVERRKRTAAGALDVAQSLFDKANEATVEDAARKAGA